MSSYKLFRRIYWVCVLSSVLLMLLPYGTRMSSWPGPGYDVIYRFISYFDTRNFFYHVYPFLPLTAYGTVFSVLLTLIWHFSPQTLKREQILKRLSVAWAVFGILSVVWGLWLAAYTTVLSVLIALLLIACAFCRTRMLNIRKAEEIENASAV